MGLRLGVYALSMGFAIGLLWLGYGNHLWTDMGTDIGLLFVVHRIFFVVNI